MSGENTESHALYRATLKSESYRIIGLLAVLVGLVVFTIARGIRIGGFGLLWAQTLVLLVVIAHEVRVFLAVRKALQKDKDVTQAMWAINVFVESQLPTIALFLLLASQWMTPYQVLVAPAVLLYFLFIILSTLRLSPSLSVLTGLLSALGYLFVTFYIKMTFHDSAATDAAFPLPIYVIYAGLIATAGIIAGVVSQQIRGYVASALREAELENELKSLNHDLDIARSIQQGLLPTKSLVLDRFEVAGWNQPADQTGGDYFDWQSLPDGRFAISLGDATGHGIGPALVSASCRAYARASFLANGHGNDLLERLNKLLVDDLSANRFVTFAVAFLDPSNSKVEVLSAGHGPILWYKRKTNEIENLEAQGIPLGMLAAVKYGHAQTINLSAGDLLVLVTDGFYEWTNPDDEEFGLSRLNQVISESHDDSSEAIIVKLRSAVMEFCRGTKQQDDLTAVILKMSCDDGAGSSSFS
jgi:serine phosphatase RsbU (regulator of sigma subunit)